MMKGTRIDRYLVADHPIDATASAHETFGEDVGWGRAIEDMYRLLAGSDSNGRFPSAPQSSPPGNETWQATAYWTPLLHLLLYTLGWADPAAGLTWWAAAGYPTDDPRLALVDGLWRADGQLPALVAHLRRSMNLTNVFVQDRAVRSMQAANESEMAALCSEALAAIPPGASNPLFGGWDPLHLAVHHEGPTREIGPQEPRPIITDRPRRRAILVLPSTAGWYRCLMASGLRSLPDVAPRNWHVDVYAEPVGWLGEYRRSTVTGLWFAGKHSLHMRGNPWAG